MRKHSKRVPRTVSALITPGQHADLMLAPRMHLEMMLTQTVDLDYQRSVMGVFNIAVALAYLQNKPQIQQQFEAAQTVMLQLIRGARSPNQEEGDFLLRCFNQADRHIGIQRRATLVRAIEFVDRMIAGRDSSDNIVSSD